MKQVTQEEQVINALEQLRGFATLRRLNEVVDFSNWKTKTPEATIRRIVQESDKIFRIQPGLWALESCRKQVLSKLQIEEGNRQSEEQFSHGYYQGLLVEIGKYQHKNTYVPAQDQNRRFLDKPLKETADTIVLPSFTYEHLLRRAKTVDVIWFNERNMPSDFYEVEHTTDIKNALSKFYELQDFFSRFYIVAHEGRRREFNDKISASIFSSIKSRVRFLEYDKVASMHSAIKEVNLVTW